MIDEDDFVIGNDVWISFDVPEDLIFLTDLKESDFSIVIDVPVVESQVFVDFAYDNKEYI